MKKKKTRKLRGREDRRSIVRKTKRWLEKRIERQNQKRDTKREKVKLRETKKGGGGNC